MKIYYLVFASFLCTPVFAFKDVDCAKSVWLAKGWFRKYDIKYTGVDFMSSKTTTKEGSTKTSSGSSTQATTMSSDPGLSTGYSTSVTQAISSWGKCSLIANERWMRRESYIAENSESLMHDAAKGSGEYLETFLFLSGCPDSVKNQFFSLVHNKYDYLFDDSKEPYMFSSSVDELLRQDKEFSSSCQVFPKAS